MLSTQTLYNGRRMVCVSADNPAVSTVLELSEANCVPSNRNITVQIQAAGSVAPVVYARDLALTAVISFIGESQATKIVLVLLPETLDGSLVNGLRVDS